ncbi:hypothetical protein AKO1_015645 [Acrasis kona]|uniref:Glycoside hydrolase family 42 N-terminal domain-containing protein n=1 Tax=Acrasis kona TaxID=1008807 RepID=A0AAW2ZGG7_9EUKA
MRVSLIALLSLLVVANCFIIMKDGYFYDNDKGKSFIPRGISYQTFVQDIGQWITYPQIEYDLREMRKANINSVRVDFAWRDIESDGEGIYKWERFDFLVNICEQYDMKMLVLIGYQWPPNYFLGHPGQKAANLSDGGWFSIHPPSPAPGLEVLPETYIFDEYWVSDVMSFTHPKSIEKYCKFLAAVSGRYKNSKAITGWVVGNEYGFLGLWSFRFDGYEQSSLDSFHKYLTDKYDNNIQEMNSIWKKDYKSFDAVMMPITYDRDDPAWADLVQWREDNVANFIAQGVKAVRQADPNHLLTYSMVGMIFGGVDWMYQAEDNKKIAYACAAAGAPLAFWAINNYPSSYPGNELRTATFGIEYAKRTGLPTVYTETGSSSTDAGYIGFDDPEDRQGKLLRNNAWEAYTSGIIGVHIFTWPDRDYITVREYGFGILKRYREPKKSYQYMLELFYQVALIEQHLPKLFTSLHFASYDVGFYWPSTVDQMYNRYQNNMAGIWGPMTRLGLRCRFL